MSRITANAINARSYVVYIVLYIHILYGIFQRVSEFVQTNVEFLKRKAIREEGRSTSGKSVSNCSSDNFPNEFQHANDTQGFNTGNFLFSIRT